MHRCFCTLCGAKQCSVLWPSARHSCKHQAEQLHLTEEKFCGISITHLVPSLELQDRSRTGKVTLYFPHKEVKSVLRVTELKTRP